MSYFRCYEIKVTLADLKSSAKQTFLGDYNYLVVTNELWEKIQANPDLKWKYSNQGILIFSELRHNLGITSVKKAKKQNVTLYGFIIERIFKILNVIMIFINLFK